MIAGLHSGRRPQAAPMVERHAVLGFAEEQHGQSQVYAADGPVPTIRVSVTKPQIGSPLRSVVAMHGITVAGMLSI